MADLLSGKEIFHFNCYDFNGQQSIFEWNVELKFDTGTIPWCGEGFFSPSTCNADCLYGVGPATERVQWRASVFAHS